MAAPVPAQTPAGLRLRALTDQAIAAALEADWAKAVELNQHILEASPDDVETRSRYGRALIETGKLEDARAAYAEVLKTNPHDVIALRNTARIAALTDHRAKASATKTRTQTRLFIEDMGKTGILRLINPAPAHLLAKYSPGAEAELREQQGLLAVHARDGELLGFLEPKVGRRLIQLIRDGNEYLVALVSNDQRDARVAVREVLQSSANAQRISFPGHHRPAETKERPYIKGTFFRYGEDEELELEEGEGAEEDAAEAAQGVIAGSGIAEGHLLEEEEGDQEDDEEEE